MSGRPRPGWFDIRGPWENPLDVGVKPIGLCLADPVACPLPVPKLGPFEWHFGDGASLTTAPRG